MKAIAPKFIDDLKRNLGVEIASAFTFRLNDLSDPIHTQKHVLTPMEEEVLKLHNEINIRK
jgi:hypothetical protein